MFATGMSYAESNLDVTQFKYKLFNFARSSQDLYYNYQTAKFALSCVSQRRIRYALIELSPYKFHYDLSKSTNLQKILRKEYFKNKMPLEQLDINNPFYMKNSLNLTPQTRLQILLKKDGGRGKDFSETRAENIKIFDDYLTLCEENNIQPIIFLPPMTKGYMKLYNKQRLDEFQYLVGQACKKHQSAIFIDGWKLQFLKDSDFYDYGHMNIHGAKKFSAFLNEIIEFLDTKKT